MTVLVVNCGSSSIKYQLFRMPENQVLAKGVAERIGDASSALIYQQGDQTERREVKIEDHADGMRQILDTLVHADSSVIEKITEIGAVGHRVVHGGEEFTGSVRITDAVIASIERFSDLAPLHNPPNLTGIQAATDALPDIPHVACFDTAFHTTLPKLAFIYSLPYELYERYGIRRYGFHGTSHRHVARRAAQILGKHKYDINCITCHLGNGCSVTAVKDGRSIDTSMGLTPLEGVLMGTRSGNFDPAILFYLAGKGYSVDELNKMCNKQSGLLGVSGTSNDMRTLSEQAKQGDERARLAIDMFCYRIKKYIGLYAVVLKKVDAVVFTGGIGENAANAREEICDGLGQIGAFLDTWLNEKTVGGVEGRISTLESHTKLLVVPTNEEGAIAADTYHIATGGQAERAADESVESEGD